MAGLSLSDYINAVAEHLALYGRSGIRPPTYVLAAARDSGVSPRKFAEYLVRRNAN